LTGSELERSPADWLEGLARVGWRPGLERTRELMAALGSPQREYRTIHVVGTNGKTSTTLYAAALLRALGLRDGSLTSPHLDDWTERVRIAGRMLDRPSWLEALETVQREVGLLEGRDPSLGPVSQFEAATAAGFLALARAGVEAAVIEAGLGGRLDSTNVLESEVTVLTSIGLDHTEWLGETREEIATEKLAVLRPGTTLVTGPLPDGVGDLAERVAVERDAELVTVVDPGEGVSGPTGRYARIDFALALAAVERLFGPVGPEERMEAVAGAGLRGRMELVRSDPPVVLDVAHNPDGIASLIESLPSLIDDRSLVVVFGCLDDRDPDALLAPLAGRAVEVIACLAPGSGGPAGRSGLDPALIGDAAGRLGLPVSVVDESAAAVRAAIRAAEASGAAVLVCGSHGLVAEIARLQP
jgi:dihydrofolate synthase/folylpolyglutamate synthase